VKAKTKEHEDQPGAVRTVKTKSSPKKSSTPAVPNLHPFMVQTLPLRVKAPLKQ
jgi:hypothetical protein